MKSSTVTSFRKKGNDTVNIPGTRVSVQNAQLLTFIGSATLDFFLGGGLAIGTVCVIEEDHYGSYSDLLMKYFLAEGVARSHSIFFASGDKDPTTFLKNLPAVKTIEPSEKFKSTGDEPTDNLKIAWRYRNQSGGDDVKVESQNVGYDLSLPIQKDLLERCLTSTWNPTDHLCDVPEESRSFLKVPYSDLYKSIKQHLETHKFRISSKTPDNVLRIGIHSVATPLWHVESKEAWQLQFIRFLYTLKALLRSSFAVAVITIPSFLLTDKVLLSRICQVCDTVINLESFVGSDKKSNPLFKDFDGLLHIKKLPVLNTFIYQSITPDLAFKLKKKGLLIERLHLPPDFEDPLPDQQAQFGCSSGLGKKLDF